MGRFARGIAIAFAACGFAVAMAAARSGYAWHLPQGVSPPPVPADNPMSPAKVTLGRRLFYDADLSRDGTTACATCHEQHRAFAEGNATHGGVGGAQGLRNVPGLANVAYFDPLTWGNPAYHRLEQQIFEPLEGTHPVEMGMAHRERVLAQRLGADACYRKMFAAAFPREQGRITVTTITRAITAFERTLVSYDAPYDRFRRGQADAISPDAKRGAALFNGGRYHCSACHTDANFTDGKFHAIGLYNLDGKGAYPARDRGLFDLTHKPSDMGRFRTPPLRNVALTAPYMHDGSVKTLADAIRDHLRPEKGAAPSPLRDKRLSNEAMPAEDRDAIIAFLSTLTDRHFVSDPRFSLPKTACGRKLY